MKTKPQIFFDSEEFIAKLEKICHYKTSSLLKMARKVWLSPGTENLSDAEMLVLDQLVKCGEIRK